MLVADGIYLGTAGIAYMFYHISKLSAFSFNKAIYQQQALGYIKPALKVAQSTKSLKVPGNHMTGKNKTKT